MRAPGRSSAAGNGNTGTVAGRSAMVRYFTFPACKFLLQRAAQCKTIWRNTRQVQVRVVHRLRKWSRHQSTARSAVSRKQDRRQLASGGQRRLVGRTPSVEELQQLLARPVVLPGAI